MIYKVLKIITKLEENFNWDVEAQGHHYDVEWKNNKLILSLTNSYSFYDECDDLQHKDNKEKIKEINCNAEEFINFTIQIYEAKIDAIRSQYDYFGGYENGYLIPKIKIHMVW